MRYGFKMVVICLFVCFFVLFCQNKTFVASSLSVMGFFQTLDLNNQTHPSSSLGHLSSQEKIQRQEVTSQKNILRIRKSESDVVQNYKDRGRNEKLS